MMLNREHIMTILAVGVLISGALWLVTEWAVKRTLWGVAHGEWAKKWLPITLGLPIGTFGFPAVYGEVVRPLTWDWSLLGWLALGAFLGVVAGVGSKLAHDTARAVIGKVAQ